MIVHGYAWLSMVECATEGGAMSEETRKLDYRDPEWLAEQLGVDKTTIYRYLQEGTLPGLQLGRKWLVSERQLIEFLDAEARRPAGRGREELPTPSGEVRQLPGA